ncbi:Sulfotransferase 1C2A [Holothuria leucospilota]|uniref:Sulfotransferase 1C2A n=1 Tax=Holothuria leucospilota TaxID=206669 RepID=A0A9Q1BH25_HOLLE|nr:Sulfotransferase 1C2A [Holothuria leucospilota]
MTSEHFPTPTPAELFKIASFNEQKGVWFPPLVQENSLKRLETFEIREEDLILATYPKCGTHWMMEVLELMKHDGNVDKIERVKNQDLVGCIEFAHPPDFQRTVSEALENEPSPRFFSSHLPCHLLPPQVWSKKPKIVYLTRNPKDAALSFFRFFNSASGDPATHTSWDDFYDKFVSEKAMFGNWFDHTLGYWNHRNDDHVIFITFEEMKKDLRSVIRRLQAFLGLTITPEGMERILEHASLEGMKKTYAKIEKEHELGRLLTRAGGIMPFLQKGHVGGWKTIFTVAQSERMDKMLEEKLKGTGLEAHYK